MSTPAWATALVARVAKEEGRDFLPEFTWRRSSRKPLSSGSTWPVGVRGFPLGQITVTAGKGASRAEQKNILLHELAHWLMPKGTAHKPAYWDKAWVLYRRYRLPVRQTLSRETNSPGSYKAYCRTLKNPARPHYYIVEGHSK